MISSDKCWENGKKIRLTFKATVIAIVLTNAYSIFVQSIVEGEEFDIPKICSGKLPRYYMPVLEFIKINAH